MSTPVEPLADHQHPIAPCETPSQAAVLAVGEATERDLLDLPPIGRAIGSDPLDQLFDSSAAPNLSLRFAYANCVVTVTHTYVAVRVGAGADHGETNSD
jgi:hypothetical protein